jgi:hypothetical protein
MSISVPVVAIFASDDIIEFFRDTLHLRQTRDFERRAFVLTSANMRRRLASSTAAATTTIVHPGPPIGSTRREAERPEDHQVARERREHHHRGQPHIRRIRDEHIQVVVAEIANYRRCEDRDGHDID